MHKLDRSLENFIGKGNQRANAPWYSVFRLVAVVKVYGNAIVSTWKSWNIASYLRNPQLRTSKIEPKGCQDWYQTNCFLYRAFMASIWQIVKTYLWNYHAKTVSFWLDCRRSAKSRAVLQRCIWMKIRGIGRRTNGILYGYYTHQEARRSWRWPLQKK